MRCFNCSTCQRQVELTSKNGACHEPNYTWCEYPCIHTALLDVFLKRFSTTFSCNFLQLGLWINATILMRYSWFGQFFRTKFQNYTWSMPAAPRGFFFFSYIVLYTVTKNAEKDIYYHKPSDTDISCPFFYRVFLLLKQRIFTKIAYWFKFSLHPDDRTIIDYRMNEPKASVTRSAVHCISHTSIDVCLCIVIWTFDKKSNNDNSI